MEIEDVILYGGVIIAAVLPVVVIIISEIKRSSEITLVCPLCNRGITRGNINKCWIFKPRTKCTNCHELYKGKIVKNKE